jgi:hypothetical protein
MARITRCLTLVPSPAFSTGKLGSRCLQMLRVYDLDHDVCDTAH